MSLFTLGKLEIRNGQTHIETHNHALAASLPMIQQLQRQMLAKVERDYASALFGLPVITSKYLPQNTVLVLEQKEPAMARTTGSIRVKVYDGPHHGRILIVPTGKRVFTLPNPMPAGEMWGPGRSNPSQFTAKEYMYELRTPMHGGEPYLGFVESTKHAYQIPVAPSVKISNEALTLVRKLRDESFNFGVGSNGSTSERYAMLQRAEKALVEYVSRIERESYAYIPQTSTVRY